MELQNYQINPIELFRLFIVSPYQCSDGFFIRMGANSQKMGRDQLVDFLQAEGVLRFEEQYHPRFNFEKHYNPERLNAF